MFYRDSVAENLPSCETMEITNPDKDGYKNIDELLEDIGAKGKFQWLLFTALLLIQAPGNWWIYQNSKATLLNLIHTKFKLVCWLSDQ